MAAFFKIFLLFIIGLALCAQIYAQRGRGRGNRIGGGRGVGGGRRGSIGGGRGRGRIYRSVPYNDDDVYGYESNYPGSEGLYVNYKSSEARAKRAPEFARSIPYNNVGGQGIPGQDQGEMGYAAPDFGFQ